MAEVVVDTGYKPWAMTAAGEDEPIQYTARNFRRIFFGLFETAGCLRSTWLKVKQHSTGADFTIDIASGDAIVSGGGSYYYYAYAASTHNLNLNSINKNPSSTRTHKVWFCVFDKGEGSLLDYAAKLVFCEDIGAGAPDPTNNPIAKLLLAEVKVSPGQANISDGHIVDKRAMAALRGDMQKPDPVIPTPPTVYPIASGTKPVNVPNGTSFLYGPIKVTLPTGRFTDPPDVVVTQTSLPGGSGFYMWKIAQIYPTYFNVWLYDSQGNDIDSSTSVDFSWIATRAR